MDDLVERALARWPNVPAIAGWLKLGMLGDWLLTGPAAEGLSISNARILNFIARNYSCEADGRYYFQNGPQKAYVDLAYTPWVYRIHPLDTGDWLLATHTGLVDWPKALFQDEEGRVLIQGGQGIGLLHSADMGLFAGGLCELPTGLAHQVRWCIPDADPATLVPARIPLRKLRSVEAGQRELLLPVSVIDSAEVPVRFRFNPNPQVSHSETKS